MAKSAKKKRFRLQFAVRAIVEIEVSADTVEDAVTMAREDKSLFQEYPWIADQWEEIDSNRAFLGVWESDPGWSIIER